jgi:DNA recombination protein RmuC
MEVLLYFLAGIVLASIGAYFVLRSIKSSAAKALTKALEDAAKIAAAEKDAVVAQLKADLNNANENLQKAEDALKNAKTDAQESVIKAKSEAEERYIKQLDEYKNAQKEANEKLEALHNQALKTMKEQLETKTRDMLKERQDEFAKTSKEKLESLLNPFKTDLENMKKSVENNQKEQIELKSSMETNIENLIKQTNLTAQSANSLADALKHKGKVHGDWGESVLEEILEESGLREGLEYEKQSNIEDENNTKFRPDVIIHFPEGKNLIVDSKASLTAYTEALEAETDDERKKAVKRHSESVKKHIKELTDKRYQDNVENAMQYVLMFIPNEGAYVMALNDNPKLLQEAYRQGVIIVNPTNLMMTLNLVLIAWQQTRQEDNCRDIIDKASKMYEKLILVVESFTALGTHLKGAQKKYKEGFDRLCEGDGNLLKKMNELKALGVTSTKKIKTTNSRKRSIENSAMDDIPALESGEEIENPNEQDF